MTFRDALYEYVKHLADKVNNGTLTESRYIALTDKLAEWHAVAEERGIE